jgi:drug/metabolite transporter (DMT)-like permease
MTLLWLAALLVFFGNMFITYEELIDSPNFGKAKAVTFAILWPLTYLWLVGTFLKRKWSAK